MEYGLYLVQNEVTRSNFFKSIRALLEATYDSGERLRAIMPASVAQLDAGPTGDQVAGSTPSEVGNILLWKLIMKYFLGHSLPSADSRRAVVSFWQKNVHNTG